jgi:hydrogenase maturation protease
MASAQVLLHVSDGEWVPPRDPPPALRAANEACQNEGLWPILVGSPGQRQQLLCSPIIVDDYAQVAPESAHAFFDLTEIDELLALRLQTLSAAEQHEIATSPDPTVRDVLHQATNMPAEQLLGLHGARRAAAVGQRVRLRPSARADIMDLALANRAATIVAIENDLEQRTYVAVTIDDDPGKDLGALGQPGHRFFFRPDEVVPVD